MRPGCTPSRHGDSLVEQTSTPPTSTGTATATPTRRLIPLASWPQVHPWPPLGGLRHLVRHRTVNGFAPVLRRVGGRLLIDEAAFFAWADGRERPERDAAAVTPEAGAG